MTYKEFKDKSISYYKKQIDKELNVVVIKKKTKAPYELIVTNEHKSSLIHFTMRDGDKIQAQGYNAVMFTEYNGKDWF